MRINILVLFFCLSTIPAFAQRLFLQEQLSIPSLEPDSNPISTNAISYWSDSILVKGVLLEPLKPGHYPVIIFNRGGNRSFGRIDEQLIQDWLLPIAKAGYIIIASQYRNQDEYGGRDVADVLQLLELITELSYADTNRIAMYGWSRGGLMTYLALTKTCKIKTAIIGGAPSDLTDVVAQRPKMDSLFSILIPNYHIHKTEALQQRSVINWPEQLCKDTSLLLLHGQHDDRVCSNQALQLNEKLQLLQRQSKLVIFKEDDHILSKHRYEKDQLILSWLKEHL